MESQGKQTSVEVALNNPMILTHILQQSCTQLKDCRLVCHFWNDMVLALPNTRFALRPMKKDKRRYILNDPLPFFTTCFTLDERLAKRISATCSTALTDPTRCIDSFATKMMHIGDKFSDFVQILEIFMDYEVCLRSVYQVLTNCCPNLKQLRISLTNVNAYTRYRNLLRGGEVEPLPESLSVSKPHLTLLRISSGWVSPFLASLIQVVVSASPNLRDVTLPLGLFPDFEKSKHLATLTIALDDIRPIDIARAEENLSKLSLMLAEVGDKLVSLTFCNVRSEDGASLGDFDNSKLPGFQFPKIKMLKLQYFRNEMADIFQCSDLLRNTESFSVLKTLVIGKASKKSNCVEEILRSVFYADKIFPSMKNLKILEMHDPTLLEGLKTTFPNLEGLEVKTFYKTDFRGDASRMELGVVLESFGRWEELQRLRLWVPSLPEEMINVIGALLKGKQLYKALKMFETGIRKWTFVRHELTTEEMDLFKELLLAMNKIGRVVIYNLSLSPESMKTISDFMVSNELPVSKLKIFEGGPMYLEMD